MFGGSWGSTLSLAYAETHPAHVSELVLRGIFTVRSAEIRWFYQEGASFLFPDRWEEYLAPIPEAERDDLVQAYHRRLTGDDPVEQLRAAKAWSKWEDSTITLLPSPRHQQSHAADRAALAFARIENHYFVNAGFMEEGQLIPRRLQAARHSRHHHPGPLRRSHAGAHRLGPAPRLARGRVPPGARLRPRFR